MAKKSSVIEDFIDLASKLPRWVRGLLDQRTAKANPPNPCASVNEVAEQIEPVLAPEPVKPPPPKKPTPPIQPKPPACPHCKKPMVMKVARTGRNAGGDFWGCTDYPKCRGIRAIFPTAGVNKPK